MPDSSKKKSGEGQAPGAPRPLADEPVFQDRDPEAGEQSPLTDTGLPVEEQIRKEWDPNKDGGLPTPLKDRAQ